MRERARREEIYSNVIWIYLFSPFLQGDAEDSDGKEKRNDADEIQRDMKHQVRCTYLLELIIEVDDKEILDLSRYK
jgi:hypothetical protein